MREKIKEHLLILSKLLCICPSLFEKISTKKDIACTEISYQFLAPKVSVLRWNIPTNSVLQPIHFQLQRKPLGIIYSSFFDLPSHSQGSLPLGIMKRIRPLLNFLYLYPQVANFPCESDVRSKKLAWINYQVRGLSVQLKNGRLEVLELVALFLLKTETCDANIKTFKSFS